MKWFSGVNSHNEKLYNNYIKMYKVAVVTAKQTNPNIQPYLISNYSHAVLNSLVLSKDFLFQNIAHYFCTEIE